MPQLGEVYHLFIDFPNNPKNKFLILVAETPEPLGFLINSGINDFKRKLPHLLVAQIEIFAAEYPEFLNYDSYIDCSQAIGLTPYWDKLTPQNRRAVIS